MNMVYYDSEQSAFDRDAVAHIRAGLTEIELEIQAERGNANWLPDHALIIRKLFRLNMMVAAMMERHKELYEGIRE